MRGTLVQLEAPVAAWFPALRGRAQRGPLMLTGPVPALGAVVLARLPPPVCPAGFLLFALIGAVALASAGTAVPHRRDPSGEDDESGVWA